MGDTKDEGSERNLTKEAGGEARRAATAAARLAPDLGLLGAGEVARSVEQASRALAASSISAHMHDAVKAASLVNVGLSDEIRRSLQAVTHIDAGLSGQLRAMTEAVRAVQDLGSPAASLIEAMTKNQREIQESFASMSRLGEAVASLAADPPWMKAMQDAQALAARLDPAPWAASLGAGLDLTRFAGLSEVLNAEVEASARLAALASPLAASLREFESFTTRAPEFPAADFALMNEAVRSMPAVARPRLHLRPEAEDEAHEPDVRVSLEIDSALFNPLEAAEILVWTRRHGPPVTCSCLTSKQPGDAYSLLVMRVLLQVDHAVLVDAALPSIVFECGDCGRQVFHRAWEELRRAGGGLELIEGGLSPDEAPSTAPGPDLSIVQRDD
jgi:hypothetical protein